MVEPATVRRLLDSVEWRLRRLEELAPASVEDYLADQDVQDAVERNLQLAIQSCIDLAVHVLADHPGRLPEEYADAFRNLGDLGVLDASLAGRLAEMARFRNVLVHQYAEIVPRRVYRHLADLPDIRSFVTQLVAHLDREPDRPDGSPASPC